MAKDKEEDEKTYQRDFVLFLAKINMEWLKIKTDFDSILSLSLVLIVELDRKE